MKSHIPAKFANPTAPLEMPKVVKERNAAAQRKAPGPSAAQRKAANTTTAVRQSITFNKDFGQHILRVGSEC